MDSNGEEGAVFVSLFFPLLLYFLLSPSLFVRAAVGFLGCPVMDMGF